MRPTENIEKLVRKLRYKASDRTRRRILGNVVKALENNKEQNSANIQRNIWVIVAKSKIAQIAVAVVIIIATCIFLIHQKQTEEITTQQVAQITKSPAELTTLASLSFAYRQGGMEMVEQMCDKALKMAGQRPANISMQEFFEEINNGKSERTEL